MISLRDVVTGFGNRDPLAEVWRRSLHGGGGGSAVITGVPPLRYIGDGRPLTDYLISGNAVQDGTPSADAPVEVQGCGVRTGNLLDYTTVESTSSATATPISGGISVSGQYYVKFRTVKFAIGNTYTMSWKANTTSGTSAPSWRFHYSDNTYSVAPSSGGALMVEKEVDELLLYVSTAASCVVDFTEIMLNLGSTALPYEPYGYKLPLTVNGTEYPIYLGQVESTRRVKKLVLTGEENWIANTTAALPNIIMYTKVLDSLANTIPICTHYVGSNASTWVGLGVDRITISILSAGTYRLSINVGEVTLSDFKSYLAQQYAAGTPVTVWYVLAEPETAVVNEPLMKIGDYADTVSAEQAGVTIPTVSGANVLDVPTEVPPSEIAIKGGIRSV